MDFRDIEYFAVLAKHGQLVRAAEALGLSQPALSLSLRRLEKSAQAKLVKRTPKGVELTAVGTALLTHVRRLRLARDDLTREVTDLAQGRAGHLRIGAGPATAENALPAACNALLKDAPKVTFNVTVSGNDVLLPELSQGSLDIVVNHIPQVSYPDVIHEPLWEDEFVVYASASHRLAGRKRVALSDLAQERWTLTAASAFLPALGLHRMFEEQGLPPPQITMVSESVTLRFRMVASSDLIGLSTRRGVQLAAPHLGLAILPIKMMNWMRPVGVFYRREAYLAPAARRFIEILKATAKEVAAKKQ